MMIPKNKEALSPFPLLAALATFAAVAVLVVFPIRDPDTFWHIANGRAMVETGRIVQEEIFSYTAFGKHFNNHQWLAQIILFLAYSAGGAAGLLTFKVAMALAVNVLQFRTARLMGATVLESAFLCLLMMHFAVSRYVERPQLFSFLGLSLLGLILYSYRKESISSRGLIFIPVIMVLWDCLHGAAYGLMFLMIFVGAETAKHLLQTRFADWGGMRPMPLPLLRTLWVWTGITFFCMLVSPFGLLRYDVFFNLVNQRTETQFIEEFMSLPMAVEYLHYWLLLGATGLAVIWTGRRTDLTFLLLYAAFGLLFIRYVRAIEAFSIVILPILAFQWVHLREVTATKGWRHAPLLIIVALTALLAYTVKIKLPYDNTHELPTPGLVINWRTGLNENVYPVGSVRFIKKNGLSGNMFNSDIYGGYLSHFLAPERKIFQYNHPSIFSHHFRFLRDEEYRRNFNISYAIVHDEEDRRVFSDYITVYREPFAELRLKNTPEHRPLIERYGITYFDPLKDLKSLVAQGEKPEVFPVLVKEMADYLSCRTDHRVASALAFLLRRSDVHLTPARGLQLLQLARQQNNENEELLATEGFLHTVGNHDPQRGRQAFQAALRLKKNMPWAQLNLAYLELDLGNNVEAVKLFETMVKENEKYQEALYGLGLAYYKSGRYREATNKLNKYVSQNPGSPWTENARVLLEKMRSNPM